MNARRHNTRISEERPAPTVQNPPSSTARDREVKVMDEQERAALVEELTSAMLGADPYYLSPHIDLAEACIPIIERLLTSKVHGVTEA